MKKPSRNQIIAVVALLILITGFVLTLCELKRNRTEGIHPLELQLQKYNSDLQDSIRYRNALMIQKIEQAQFTVQNDKVVQQRLQDVYKTYITNYYNIEGADRLATDSEYWANMDTFAVRDQTLYYVPKP